MASTEADWRAEFEAWLAPFLARLKRAEQRRWAPAYLQGLPGPGERKSVEPMAARVAPGDVQQLHHFISASPWRCEPLEAELVRAADRLVGGPDAVLVIDDTALVKQGRHSVGAALADADYGRVAEFRQTLSEQGLPWAVGVGPTQTVYPADVVIAPAPAR